MSSWAIGLLALLVATGCGGSDEILAARLARLEDRLAALEERLGAFATVDDLEEKTARLERRLAVAPRHTVTPVVPAKPAPVVRSPPPPGTGGSRLERLSELSAEYRDKLAVIQDRYADDPTAPQRLREIHELRSWFYDELRAGRAEADAALTPDVPE